MTFKAQIGDRLIKESGSIVVPMGIANVTLEIDDLKFTLEFVEDLGEPKTNFTTIDNKSVLLSLSGTGNPLGVTFDIQVGNLDNRKLYFGLFVNTITIAANTPPPRRLDYCFSLGEQVSS